MSWLLGVSSTAPGMTLEPLSQVAQCDRWPGCENGRPERDMACGVVAGRG